MVEWWNCVQTDINKYKIANWKERSKNRADWKKSIKEVKESYTYFCWIKRDINRQSAFLPEI